MKKLTNKEFITRARNIHGDIYDYSLVNYINSKTKVKIVCIKHSVFQQRPNDHLSGYGCRKCQYERTSTLNKFTNKEFIKRGRKVHGDKYDYSECEYVGYENKISIICPEHGVFQQTPHNHLSGYGCSVCKESLGEKEIRLFLEENKIEYVREKTFENCKDLKPLKFDFYLPNKNWLIEFDGIQHYESIDYFGGTSGLINNKKRDKIKNSFMMKHGMKLLRLPYVLLNENEIQETLKHYII